MKLRTDILFVLIFCCIFSINLNGQEHPNLILTQEGVKEIRKNLGTAPLFDQVLEDAKAEIDLEIKGGIDVPIPKDMAGGYTHERHKRNFFMMQKAGNLFQITEDEKYAIYIRDMLLKYAEMYPTLDIHPTKKSYATGKIFWQCLNDANWLVYTSQAYDCIYDWLKEEERVLLEKDLFIPFAEFLSSENPQFFNRIHNHSTWANAAVGMIALVMDNSELLNKALYGLGEDSIDASARDNDGGFIKAEGQTRAGFLAQLDYSFSPDGYFTEGPYYLRYAIYPFLLFSKSLSNNNPELDIFNYRDGILKKSVYGLLNQTDPNGLFFPLNDAQKGMSWEARELITAVDNIYFHCGNDPQLLSIAKLQGKVLLDETGFAVAKAINTKKIADYKPSSMLFKDGEDGEKGGVAVLRSYAKNKDETCLVFKYSAQGMGHGHFDKLAYSLYDETGEVIQDYGSARWVNIDQKGGGRYLPENQTFAKQSIAHNTVVIDKTSHFNADVKTGEANHPILEYYDANDNLQIIKSSEDGAYNDVDFNRTLVVVNDDAFLNPIIIDIFKVEAGAAHQMDLPVWFQGHLLSTSFDAKANLTGLSPMGKEYGYQHIWEEAKGKSETETVQVTWFNEYKFYSLTTAVNKEDELILGRLGANDPNFNLRRDPVFIHRKNNTKDATYASIIESHGTYSPVTEIPLGPFSSIKELSIIHDDDKYTAISFSSNKGDKWILTLSNTSNDANKEHQLDLDKTKYKWTGPYELRKIIQSSKK